MKFLCLYVEREMSADSAFSPLTTPSGQFEIGEVVVI